MHGSYYNYNPFADVRKTEMRVMFKVVDPNADAAAQFSASPSAVGDLEHFLDDLNPEQRFVALEGFPLDGSATELYPDAAAGNIGWWSEAMSNEDAIYENPPYIQVDFGEVAISTLGTSLDFDPAANSYATLIRLTYYDAAGDAIAGGEFENHSPFAVMKIPCNDYHGIKIEFLKSNLPRRRVRLSEIVFGLKLRYDANNMEKLTLIRSADIAAASLPSAQMEVTIDNTDRAYDLLAPDNFFAYLEEGKQPISATAVINGTSVNLGTLYYSGAKVSNDGLTATIAANDKIMQLDKSYFAPQDAEMQLWMAVNIILQGTGIPYRFLQDRLAMVSLMVPEDCSRREALRLVAQAACCSVWMDWTGTLCFGPLDVGMTVQTLSPDELYNYNGISVSTPVDVIELRVRDTEDENGEVVEHVFRAGEGEIIKSIDNPCVALERGQEVAEWLLSCYKRRRHYKVSNQGDPALDIGDTIAIYDAYGQKHLAGMTGAELKYDGTLSAVTSAVGGEV